MKKTTAEIILFCAANRGDSQDCVDWAIEALCQGYDSPTLRMLASLSPPLNFFEVKEWTLQALSELDIAVPSVREAVLGYASELMQGIVDHSDDATERLAILAELAMLDLPDEDNLFDFYLLHHANSDMQNGYEQHYWSGADQSNIRRIIIDRCLEWLSNHKGPST